MTISKSKTFLAIILLMHVYVFCASYFFNIVTELKVLLFLYILPVGFFWTHIRTTTTKKFIGAIATYLVCVVSAFLLIVSTMSLPGSKEHNYVMYEVCFPAMATYYGVKEVQNIPLGPVDKDGWGKWWYQHLECERNVWSGKGPVFSDNPPGYFPVQQDK